MTQRMEWFLGVSVVIVAMSVLVLPILARA